METRGDLEVQLKGMREYYRGGNTRGASWRKSQLRGLCRLLEEREAEMNAALEFDLGKHPVEAYRDEIGGLIKSANYALGCLKGWMSAKKAKLPLAAALTTAEIIPEPLGLVLIISSWNFPFGLSLEPLIGALAAGNVVVLKPSEVAPRCSSLLANVLPAYLDPKAIKVVEGGPAVSEQLVKQKWDKILFTGSARVGRIVMAAAANHLTPVTLEFGGKCPAVLDSLSSSWDREVAVQRIVGSKFSACAGQACIAIDYVIVEKKFSSTLLELMKVRIGKMLGENPRESRSMARIVNKHHFLRLKTLLEDPNVKASIVYGGSMDEKSLFIEPTILLDPPLESDLMQDEIFGPLLPIITLKKIEDSINFINSRPKPLALYVFTHNDSLRKRMVAETSSGSVTFNDAMIQYMADTLPFGGIGESGMGNYHGKFSFDTFSHHKAVLRRSFLVDFWFRFPPWNDHKLQLFRSVYLFDYLGMLLTVLGLKKSKQG
ncbi:hypothetical protein EUGRSUZ_B03683 [Eucalyptus grandis]|uniref:Aldehyde dehydrogenase n=2 Tax=Eucalyptus grandis TaxID=71139 RepID=A0A059D9Q2_EUCGR|nr:hypothetical protein EUGRSUZ_B03683 [Eucalyptus grandis]